MSTAGSWTHYLCLYDCNIGYYALCQKQLTMSQSLTFCIVTDSRPIPALLHWHNVKTSLHLASASILASYLMNIGCTLFLEWLAWFIKKSKQFNQSKIPNVKAPLTLTFSVNGYLDFEVDASFETTFVYSRRNFVLIILLNLQTANPFSAVPKINVFHLRLNVVTTTATNQLIEL